MKYLDSLRTCWKDKWTPTQPIGATEDRLLWHCMPANVANDDAVPYKEVNDGEMEEKDVKKKNIFGLHVRFNLKTGAKPDYSE